MEGNGCTGRQAHTLSGRRVVLFLSSTSTYHHTTADYFIPPYFLPSPSQVRPNEHVRFKQISLAEAFTAISRTDALMDALTAVARGTLSLEQAEKQLAEHKVGGVVRVWGGGPGGRGVTLVGTC